jgi:hypothetical protein
MWLEGARVVVEERDVLEAKIEELESEGLKVRMRVQRARHLEPILFAAGLGPRNRGVLEGLRQNLRV